MEAAVGSISNRKTNRRLRKDQMTMGCDQARWNYLLLSASALIMNGNYINYKVIKTNSEAIVVEPL